ncbi:MAG: co-chaperone DjlA [Neisseriaceae bacterium]
MSDTKGEASFKSFFGAKASKNFALLRVIKASLGHWSFWVTYLLLVVVTGSYWFSAWIAVVVHFLRWEINQNLKVRYIHSQFFPGELTLLEYNVLVTFYTLGCLTKVKGRILTEDIVYAESLMGEFGIPKDSWFKLNVINCFKQGKAQQYDLKRVLAEFSAYFRDQPWVRTYFFNYQLKAVFKEGTLLEEEFKLLEIIAKYVGISEYSFLKKIQSAQESYNLKQKFRAQNQSWNEENARSRAQGEDRSFNGEAGAWEEELLGSDSRNEFRILGVSEQADYSTVKKAYRRLIKEYHPDKLAFKEVPTAVLEMAKNKSQEIIGAYDFICKTKGWK